jgi:hypothetical protein
LLVRRDVSQQGAGRRDRRAAGDRAIVEYVRLFFVGGGCSGFRVFWEVSVVCECVSVCVGGGGRARVPS